jgi:hemolysin activation/secretion protein
MKGHNALSRILFNHFGKSIGRAVAPCLLSMVPAMGMAGGIEARQTIGSDPLLAQTMRPQDRFLQPELEPLAPLPEEKEPLLAPAPTEMPPQPVQPKGGDASIYVSKIQVLGSTIYNEKQFSSIVEPLEGREATLRELWAVADKITELYVQAGYLTSRAILREQSIRNGIIQIQIIEGRLAQNGINIKGAGRLAPYVRARLALGVKPPLRRG